MRFLEKITPFAEAPIEYVLQDDTLQQEGPLVVGADPVAVLLEHHWARPDESIYDEPGESPFLLQVVKISEGSVENCVVHSWHGSPGRGRAFFSKCTPTTFQFKKLSLADDAVLSEFTVQEYVSNNLVETINKNNRTLNYNVQRNVMANLPGKSSHSPLMQGYLAHALPHFQ